MRAFRLGILHIAIVIVTVMLHTAQLQWSTGIPTISWVIVLGMALHMVNARNAVLTVLLASLVLETQSQMPYGIQLVALLTAFTIVRFSFKRLFKSDALHTYVMNVSLWTVLNALFLTISILAGRSSGVIEMSGFSVSELLVSTGWQILWHGVIIAMAFKAYQLARRMFVRTSSDFTQYA
jgi:membrane-associated HD superfamily phosphohydrolase